MAKKDNEELDIMEFDMPGSEEESSELDIFEDMEDEGEEGVEDPLAEYEDEELIEALKARGYEIDEEGEEEPSEEPMEEEEEIDLEAE